MEPASAIGILSTAAVLGVTHAIEPDHVAGISALTHEAGSSKLSAIVGACFAIGHVFLVTAWVTGAFLLVGTTSFPQSFEAIGLVVVGIVLAILGGVLGVTGMRKLLHKHHHEHSGTGRHTHFHLHLPASITNPFRPTHHAHEHTVFEYLKIGIVGGLFTLSPPISMIAFISVFMPSFTEAFVLPVILTYGLAITVTMTLIGGGAGKLFNITKEKGETLHAASQVVAAVLISLFGGYILFQNLPPLLL